MLLFLSCGNGPQPADTTLQVEPVRASEPVQTPPPVQSLPPEPAPVQSPPPEPEPQVVQIPVPEPEPEPQVVQSPPPEPEPQVIQSPPPEPQPVIAVVPEENVFDPGTITQEKFDTTKADVQNLIQDLNRIIRARNYNAWRTYLADSYFEVISSRAFLDERTEDLYKRDLIVASNLGRDPRRVQKKLLRTPKDYFDNVVVPSRSNDRMDDIDFVSEKHVKAYTVDSRGNRLVLYDLRLVDNKWKIIN